MATKQQEKLFSVFEQALSLLTLSSLSSIFSNDDSKIISNNAMKALSNKDEMEKINNAIDDSQKKDPYSIVVI